MTTTNDNHTTHTGAQVYPLNWPDDDPGERLQDQIEGTDRPLPEVAAADLAELGRCVLTLLNRVSDAGRMQNPAANAENAAGQLYQALYDLAEGAEDPAATTAEAAALFPVAVFDALPAPLRPYVQLGYVMDTAPEVVPRWMAAVLGQAAELLTLAVGITQTTAYADRTGRHTAERMARVLADAKAALAGAADINDGAEKRQTCGATTGIPIVTGVLCPECGGEMLIAERRAAVTVAVCENCSHAEDWYEPLRSVPGAEGETGR
jgi:hypothetical protein